MCIVTKINILRKYFKWSEKKYKIYHCQILAQNTFNYWTRDKRIDPDSKPMWNHVTDHRRCCRLQEKLRICLSEWRSLRRVNEVNKTKDKLIYLSRPACRLIRGGCCSSYCWCRCRYRYNEGSKPTIKLHPNQTVRLRRAALSNLLLLVIDFFPSLSFFFSNVFILGWDIFIRNYSRQGKFVVFSVHRW